MGTHPIPEKYHITHANFGSWDSEPWKDLTAPTLTDKKTRLSHD
jgi:hypothetical protein